MNNSATIVVLSSFELFINPNKFILIYKELIYISVLIDKLEGYFPRPSFFIHSINISILVGDKWTILFHIEEVFILLIHTSIEIWNKSMNFNWSTHRSLLGSDLSPSYPYQGSSPVKTLLFYFKYFWTIKQFWRFWSISSQYHEIYRAASVISRALSTILFIYI